MYQCFAPMCAKMFKPSEGFKKLINGGWHYACCAECAAVVERISK